nr:S-layer homology domain-containing protein [Lysinibacillus timonensis]
MSKSNQKKYFNATMVATLVASTVAGGSVAGASAEFSDVKTTDYFFEAVKNLSERGIVNGFPDGTFKPYNNVTRGQAAVIISGALGLDTTNVQDPGFKDVPTSHPYHGAIAALANAGYINGFEDGTFGPDKFVTRNHMAIIISKAFNLEAPAGTTLPFSDIYPAYKNQIAALYANGVTAGNSPTTFGGSLNVTRGQLAQFIVKAEKINEVSEFTIEEISNSTIKTNIGDFTLGSAATGIFSNDNASALKGASVLAKVENGEIVSVKSLTLNAEGTSEESLVFDGNNTELVELTINADNVIVKNMTITGDIQVTSQVLKSSTLENVESNGQLIVESNNEYVASTNLLFATETNGPEITLKQTSVNDIVVKRNNVSITSDTKLARVTISEGVKEIEVNSDIDKITVAHAGEVILNITGKVAELVIPNKETKVELGANVEVTKLVTPEGSKVADIISNYSAVKGKITEVVDSKGTKDETATNESSSSSGSSGNSNNDDDDDDNVSVKPINGNVIASNGIYGPASGIQTIEGDLTISSPDVTLRNVTVTGKLVLGEEIGEGDVHLDGVTVQGETVVNGGGQNSVYFNDSVLATVIVNKNNGAVRIVAQGSTQVYEVQLETPTIVVEDSLDQGSSGFDDIILTEAMQSGYEVQLNGTFETINSRATSVRINLSEQTDIRTLVLNAAATVLGTGNIRLAEVNANGSTLSQRPQNVVLNNGTLTISDGENTETIDESYADSDATTTLNSISVYNGSISLELENFVTEITSADVAIVATIDGEEVELNGLYYNANQQRYNFDIIDIVDNIGEIVEITVTPLSGKVTGEAKTASFEVQTGFSGRITDIQRVGIPNLEIQFRAGIGSTEGEVVGTATTDRYGYYSINLPAGTYTGEFTSPGYLTTYMIANAASDEFLTDQNETAIRAAATNEVKIMLSWGENPRDLDSHLTGPGADNSLFHIAYYDEKEIHNGITYADLDWDDTQSYGPETTTIRELVDGKYRFYVHHFSGSNTLRNSGAAVKVFLGNATTPNQTFNVPSGEGNEIYWAVFDLIVSNNGETHEIVPVNELMDTENPIITVNGQNNHYYGNLNVSTSDSIGLAVSEGTEVYYQLTSYANNFDGENYYEEYDNNSVEDALNGQLYTEEFSISQNSSLYAIAVKDGVVVGETHVTLNIQEPGTSNPNDEEDIPAQEEDTNENSSETTPNPDNETETTTPEIENNDDASETTSDSVMVNTLDNNLFTFTFSEALLEMNRLDLTSIDTATFANTTSDSIVTIATSDTVNVSVEADNTITVEFDDTVNEYYNYITFEYGIGALSIRRTNTDVWVFNDVYFYELES